jgi:light-regulated signal transduction histidine kinase (bacteriophytochrome)
LQRSNADLQQFAYVASHDLQEPLRTITSYLQLIERRYNAALDDTGREFIGYAVDGARRMARLIQDLLAFSRIDSRGREPAPVALADALRDAVAALRLRAEEAKAVLTLPPPDTLPWVLGDDTQIASLFQNLIGNALKYSRPGEPPRIDITVSVDHDRHIATVAVRDHGIGIDPQFHDRIFQVFQRLHPAGSYEGTGIGLAICKRIVQRHHGRIWVESRQGDGATFFFSLPMIEAPAAQ